MGNRIERTQPATTPERIEDSTAYRLGVATEMLRGLLAYPSKSLRQRVADFIAAEDARLEESAARNKAFLESLGAAPREHEG